MTTRLAAVGFVLAAALAATACSSGAKSTPPSVTAAPVVTTPSEPTPSVSTPSSAAAAGVACPGGGTPAAPGGAGGGDATVPGDIPDTQAYIVYSSPDGYHIRVPEGWARSQGAGAVTFTDKFNSIHVQVSSAPAAPTVVSAQSTDIPALASSTPCFQAGKVSQVSRTGGTAVLITYRDTSTADPVTGKFVRQDVERYEFWQANKLAVITLSASQGSDNVDPWRKVTGSFAWGP